jgi:hypothetical protein
MRVLLRISIVFVLVNLLILTALPLTIACSEQLNPLRNYTMVVAAVGEVSGLAGITWVERSELQSNLVVRDSRGREVAAVRTTPRDMQLLTEILQLFFRQELGEMGKNVHIFFFPAVDSDGAPLADPRKAGNLVAMIRKIAGRDQTFEWKLPLTSLSPPKFCPTGGERVEANLKYCPWHGTDLTAQPAQPAQPAR